MKLLRAEFGIVVALAAEAQAIERNLPLGAPHWLAPRPAGWVDEDGVCVDAYNVSPAVFVCGAGGERARHAAEALARLNVAGLVSFGTIGALAPELESGALLVPEAVLDEDGHVYTADPTWRALLFQKLGRIAYARPVLTVRKPLATAEEKAAAARRTGACAVDMESAAVAAVAAERGLPFLCLRAVVDRAAQALPRAALAAVDPYGRVHRSRLFAALLRRPKELAQELEALRRLREDFSTALQALKDACPSLVQTQSIFESAYFEGWRKLLKDTP
jgi:adenosylhomocysteine nucleosidase